jgi:hypothetical protein
MGDVDDKTLTWGLLAKIGGIVVAVATVVWAASAMATNQHFMNGRVVKLEQRADATETQLSEINRKLDVAVAVLDRLEKRVK